MGMSGAAWRGEGDLNFSFVPTAFLIWSIVKRRTQLFFELSEIKFVVRRYQNRRSYYTPVCSFLFIFFLSFWLVEVANWKRLTESGLTTGVGPENGGCYREGMQRAWGTLPNCYRRHESKRNELFETNYFIREPLSKAEKLNIPAS